MRCAIIRGAPCGHCHRATGKDMFLVNYFAGREDVLCAECAVQLFENLEYATERSNEFRAELAKRRKQQASTGAGR